MPRDTNDLDPFKDKDLTCDHSDHFDSDVVSVIKKMIARYRKLYNTDDEIPIYREADMTVIEALLQRPDLTHVQLYDAIEACLNKIITGLIVDNAQIIGTGHSRLKNLILGVLSHECFNREAMQKRDQRTMFQAMPAQEQVSIQQLQEQLTLQNKIIDQQELCIQTLTDRTQILEEANSGHKDQVSELKEQLSTAQQKINDLNATNGTLQSRLRTLQAQNKELEKSNEELRKKYGVTVESTSRHKAEEQKSSFLSYFFG